MIGGGTITVLVTDTNNNNNNVFCSNTIHNVTEADNCLQEEGTSMQIAPAMNDGDENDDDEDEDIPTQNNA